MKEESKKDSLFKRAFVTRTQGFINVSEKAGFWQETAGEFNGVFKTKHTVAKDMKILFLELPCGETLVEFTESDAHPLKIKATMETKRPFVFYAGQKDFLDNLLGAFNRNRIKTGDPDFDKNYIVRADDQDSASKIFANDKIRSILLSTGVYSFVCDYDKQNSKAKLSCVVNRTVNSKEELSALFDLFCQTIDEMKALNIV